MVYVADGCLALEPHTDDVTLRVADHRPAPTTRRDRPDSLLQRIHSSRSTVATEPLTTTPGSAGASPDASSFREPMSSHSTFRSPDSDHDPWEELAEHEETLEMLIEEDVPMARDAEILLEELEKRGYR